MPAAEHAQSLTSHFLLPNQNHFEIRALPARSMGESRRDERQYIDVLAGPQRRRVSCMQRTLKALMPRPVHKRSKEAQRSRKASRDRVDSASSAALSLSLIASSSQAVTRAR